MIGVKDEKYLKDFGKNLKKLREKAEISQEELSLRSDISISQLTRIEHGRINPTLCTLKALAKGLKIKMADLFDFEIKSR